MPKTFKLAAPVGGASRRTDGRRRPSRAALAACGVLALASAGASPAASRMRADGPAQAAADQTKGDAAAHPDPSGMWTANFVLTLEATDKVPQLTATEDEARKLAAERIAENIMSADKSLDTEAPDQLKGSDGLPLVRGERRTRLVVQPADGHVPYTAEARAELKVKPDRSYKNPEDASSLERCVVGLGQPPLSSLVFSNQVQIVLTRDAVAIHTEYGDDVRIAPFSDRHRPPTAYAPHMGDSIARWEGRTLVVETVGMPDRDRRRFVPTVLVGGGSTVIERFTRLSPRELLYQFTIVDPKLYSAPWLAEFSFYATDKPMYEHACHEGNYSFANVMSGARHDEALKAAAATAPGTPPHPVQSADPPASPPSPSPATRP